MYNLNCTTNKNLKFGRSRL